jgi:hypothetical protein
MERRERGAGLGLWCLTPLSTIFQLYQWPLDEKDENYCVVITKKIKIKKDHRGIKPIK